ncbi:hypothetical protein Taro_035989 [Colocasia esculenta]|uniref:Uncharacterized protein n=1 Tax=Colocasia esculenta TaxID=4460 RepID=A0A843VW38_COLES|nr:hypothetical protein [Colocasia esculenta]
MDSHMADEQVVPMKYPEVSVHATEKDPTEGFLVENAANDLVTFRDAANGLSIRRGGIIREGSIFEIVFNVKVPEMAIIEVDFWLF